MIELKQTETFRKWWTGLKDKRGLGIILARLDRLAYCHAGDAEPVGDGVSELCAFTMAPATGSTFRSVETH
jgi:putative addiction module killer protein